MKKRVQNLLLILFFITTLFEVLYPATTVFSEEDCSREHVTANACQSYCSLPMCDMVIGSQCYDTCFACIDVEVDACEERNAAAAAPSSTTPTTTAPAREPAPDRGLIEPCPGNPTLVPGEMGCRDANILLLQLIRIAQFMLSIIGTLAFVVFVIAGFTLILSFGNAEKAKQANSMLFAAVIGLIIAFSAVIIIDFLMEVLQVGSSFRA